MENKKSNLESSKTDMILLREKSGLRRYKKIRKRDPEKKKILIDLALSKIKKAEKNNFISLGYRKRKVKI
jgi:hypothetical protein